VSTDQAAIDRLAAGALGRYRLDPDSTVRLINVSENWTYRIDEPATGRAFALRVHRPGYHTASEIDSELTGELLRQGRGLDACGLRHGRRRRSRGLDIALDDASAGSRAGDCCNVKVELTSDASGAG